MLRGRGNVNTTYNQMVWRAKPWNNEQKPDLICAKNHLRTKEQNRNFGVLGFPPSISWFKSHQAFFGAFEETENKT